jgi:hypothetical protein
VPSKETCPLKERVKFVLEWERSRELQEGYVNVAAWCRQFGIPERAGEGERVRSGHPQERSFSRSDRCARDHS